MGLSLNSILSMDPLKSNSSVSGVIIHIRRNVIENRIIPLILGKFVSKPSSSIEVEIGSKFIIPIMDRIKTRVF